MEQQQKQFQGRPKLQQQQSIQEDTMKKSGQIQVQKQMKSSITNFRPVSREKENEFKLNILNLAQDEQQFGSQIKVDLMQLQSEIDELDFDGKLRNATNLDFMKPYQSAMKKWLSQNSLSNIKQQIDKKSQLNLDTEKLLEQLSVKTQEEGLKKLFRMLSILDLICSKFTEYEILFFLRFEDSYNQITKLQQVKNSKLGMLQGGININRFSVPLANIERFQDVIISCNKMQQENLSRPVSRTGGFSSIGLNQLQVNLAGVKTRNDLIQCLEKMSSSQMQEDLKKMILGNLREGTQMEEDMKSLQALNNTKSNNNQSEPQQRLKQLDDLRKKLEKENKNLIEKLELQQNSIEDLKKQNKQYEDIIQDMKQINSLSSSTNSTQQSLNNSIEIEQKNKQIQKHYGKSPLPFKDDPQYWNNLIDDIKEAFDKRNLIVLDENEALKAKMLEKNILIEKLEQDVNEKNEMMEEFKDYKLQILKEWHKKFDSAKEYQDSYEKALLAESERFKKGFEKKIQQSKYEIEFLKRDKGKHLIDIKSKLDRETETKNLLFKKLQLFIKI